MRLSVFHSLVKTAGRFSESTISLSQRIQECANGSYFQGVELCSSQVTRDVLDECSTLDVQVLTRLAPHSIDDAFRQLDDLSSELSKVKEQDVGKVMRLIVVKQPPLATPSTAINGNKNSTLDYLSDILPVAAQFMENHPTIGQSKGERNAHGNPIDNHVLGVCHQLALLPSNNNNDDQNILQQFLDILDVLPPTRLSLDTTAATLKSLETCINDSKEEEEDTMWDVEPLIQSIDHFDFLRLNPIDMNHQKDALHQQVWNWQQEVHVKETYVSCADKHTASLLHDSFLRSV